MNHDDFLRQIASSYVEQYGEQLNRERDALEQSGPAITPGLDRKMKAKLSRKKRYFGAAGLAAACLLLMLLAPRMLRPAQDQMEGITTADAWDEDVDDAEEYDEFYYDEAEEVEEDAEYEAEYYMDDAPSAASMEGVIPISFQLPYNLSVEDVELDQGQTIYRLSDTLLDDVVMTMEYSGAVTVDEGMTEIDLGPAVAYAEATADYNKLALEWNGIEYVLTCQHDINTLVNIGYSIVI